MDQISLFREDMAAEAVEKMIRSYREELNLDDRKILSLIEKSYGDTFTKHQLEEMLKQTK